MAKVREPLLTGLQRASAPESSELSLHTGHRHMRMNPRRPALTIGWHLAYFSV